MRKNRVLILALTLVLIFGVSVGGTLAWLLDDTDPVVNTFTDSDISITLTETDTNKDNDDNSNTNQYQMIPGWTINKDPKVTVEADSEDCWLFVAVNETGVSYTPAGASTATEEHSFDDFLVYSVNTGAESTDNDGIVHGGWIAGNGTGDGKNGVPVGVYFRAVTKSDNNQEFAILGGSSYVDKMGTPNDDSDDVTISWSANQVGVKPSVTKEMMKDVADSGVEPELSFTAYAVQYWKSNGVNFSAADAWELAKTLPTTP